MFHDYFLFKRITEVERVMNLLNIKVDGLKMHVCPSLIQEVCDDGILMKRTSGHTVVSCLHYLLILIKQDPTVIKYVSGVDRWIDYVKMVEAQNKKNAGETYHYSRKYEYTTIVLAERCGVHLEEWDFLGIDDQPIPSLKKYARELSEGE